MANVMELIIESKRAQKQSILINFDMYYKYNLNVIKSNDIIIEKEVSR